MWPPTVVDKVDSLEASELMVPSAVLTRVVSDSTADAAAFALRVVPITLDASYDLGAITCDVNVVLTVTICVDDTALE